MDNIASQRHHAPKGIEDVGNSTQALRRRPEATVGDKAPQTKDGHNDEEGGQTCPSDIGAARASESGWTSPTR